ncbi:hypothetical protein LIER_21516 [Lithospermum erythrorhizon]|uniref:Uncharacterized protein n=1 Tax=Lithospermum erythrorhizon TaxID=34254 RepID=A0AAV3QTJ9_LITER
MAEIGNMIKWPEGRAKTFNVQMFESAFFKYFEDNDDQLEWFGSNSCTIVNGWEDEVRWLVQKGMGKSFKSRLRSLCIINAIYHIWLSRNRKHFEDEEQNSNSIVSKSVVDVRACVGSWRHVTRNKQNWSICTDWGFNITIFDCK